MQREDINQLWDRYKAGKATVEDMALLESWYLKFDHAAPDLSEEEFAARVEAIRLNLPVSDSQTSIQKRLWPRVAIAAAAVAAIVFGVFFFKAPSKPEPSSGSANYTNDIAPGKNTATLTLANGKTIILSDVKTGVIVNANSLKYDDGTAVERGDASLPQDDQSLTLSTPRGGTYQVRLPDGSKVWLNAASSLTYTAPLNERGGVRKVELSGEAYFEVFRNKNQPFVVTAKNLTTTVLGTHFNINAYEDESSTKATLVEGSIKLTSSRMKPGEGSPSEAVVLRPNQQAVLKGSTIKVSQANIEEDIAWKNGYFRFNDEKIESIMRKLSRWYNLEVIYKGDVPEEEFTGTVSRYKNISQALKMLGYSNKVQFKIEGRKIYVSK
ncbi:ferric-dicitrate binding protein FerR (iron transport regulator) [Pedobacter sp. AK017]|uniref:FecR family protein n=1 Tax=Pedobacter sp. AK017 TaxID=2723073 RepID=UPI00161CB456|nr:FecR family protein [Pedobacter sp. AK017]MBB5440865.1 ferric-dicitrate binding protein FerR (iron transport regulator) [Pedobacter sp. AK017]